MQNGDDCSNPLERYLGATIRELRQRHGLTIAQVSAQASISRGMLSKIENAQTSTGLDVLNRIAQALGVSMSALFRKYDVPHGGAQLVKNGAGMEVVRKGTKRGHTYHLLCLRPGSAQTLRAVPDHHGR
jgi:transcriptional regulator with XRE-family HTH domain